MLLWSVYDSQPSLVHKPRAVWGRYSSMGKVGLHIVCIAFLWPALLAFAVAQGLQDDFLNRLRFGFEVVQVK